MVEGLCGRLDRFLSLRVNRPLIVERAFGAWKKACATTKPRNMNGNADIIECLPVLDEAKGKASYSNLMDQRRSSATSKHRERMLAVFGGAGGAGAGADSEECMLCEGLSVSCAMCRVRTRKNMRAGKVVVDY